MDRRFAEARPGRPPANRARARVPLARADTLIGGRVPRKSGSETDFRATQAKAGRFGQAIRR
jgi:hypothetical protein